MRRLILGIAVAATSLAPVIGMADDQQIADYIKVRLHAEQQQGNLRGFNVDMRVDKGTVSFTGHVANRQQEMLILETAQSAGHLGVVQVVDDIDVKEMDSSNHSMMAPQAAQPLPRQSAEEPTPANPYRNATYQTQPGLSPEQFRQTSQIENVPPQYAGNGATVETGMTGPPMAFASGGGQVSGVPMAGNQMVGQPMQSYEMANTPMPMNGMMGGGCPSGDCYGGAPMAGGYGQAPVPMSYGGAAPSEAPNLPGYAWPGYAAHPNYAAVTYPKQYSPSAWPYIGPFYPYPQVPLGWRKVTLEWDDGWWQLDFDDK